MSYQNAKIWTSTIEKLRFLRAYSGEPMTSILDRLVSDELSRVEAVKESPSPLPPDPPRPLSVIFGKDAE